MRFFTQPTTPASRNESYGQALRQITGLIHERMPFVQWPAQVQAVLLVALFPDEAERPGARRRVGIETIRALRLQRHLVYLPRTNQGMGRLQAMREAMSEAQVVLVQRQAEAVRSELPLLNTLWTFRMDPDEEIAQ